jgi:hypothetical protein
MVSLGAAAASMLGGCDIEGVTPNCSDAGECFTQPGNVDPGNTAGGTGGSNSGGTGGSTGGGGGNAGAAGSSATGGNGGSAGTAGNGGSAGSGGNAGSRAGAGGGAGSNDGGPNDAAGTDAPLDRRPEAGSGFDTGPSLDVGSLDIGFLLDMRADRLDGADGTVP